MANKKPTILDEEKEVAQEATEAPEAPEATEEAPKTKAPTMVEMQKAAKVIQQNIKKKEESKK